MASENFVFVYGTLKRGEPNHHWMTDKYHGSEKFVAEGQTVEKYAKYI